MTDDQMKLHDAFVDANCQISLWTELEYKYLGMPRERIEQFFEEINNIERTMKIAQIDGFYQRQQKAYHRDN